MYALGLDIGSSSIKGAMVDVASGKTIATAQHPHEEMAIHSPHPGWAEQNPEEWWQSAIKVTQEMCTQHPEASSAVGAIGISYQMHGLVITGKEGTPLRPSIIWCDSRAVAIGEKAFRDLGHEYCLKTMLNSPGNFTASKLRWVRENEPDTYAKITHVLLPGDFIALRLTGEPTTTVTGLSEGIFWDFQAGGISRKLMEYYDIDPKILSRLVPAIGAQGTLSAAAAAALGLKAGIPIAYRAGDQPNNAFSLNVLDPGEVAATAGTSGVVYGVTERAVSDPASRVNLFAHVNHSAEQKRLGVLLCINGTGILYSWLRRMFGANSSYEVLNGEAAGIPIGAEGISILPFGNGAERMFENRTPAGRILGLDLVRHSRAHLVRAAQEGIAFAFHAGMGIMHGMGVSTNVIRAGKANLFLSPIFRQTLADISGAGIELYDTDGAVGAARGAAAGAGAYTSLREAFRSLQKIATITPDAKHVERTQAAYKQWEEQLSVALGESIH
jgi:xylulokinase